LIVRASRRLFRPEAHHLVQEYERLDKRLRASGAREDVKGAGAEALAAAEAGAAAGPRTPASASGGATEAGTPIKPSQVGAEVHATAAAFAARARTRARPIRVGPARFPAGGPPWTARGPGTGAARPRNASTSNS
jgi:hypothetical protein